MAAEARGKHMIIQSKQNRSYWSRAVSGLVPDVIIASVVAIAVNDSPVVIFFAVLIGLQALYFVLWLKTSIWQWGLFHFSIRKQVAAQLLDNMDQKQYPKPNEYLHDVDTYFDEIVSNEELDDTIRMNAAADIGGLAVLKNSGYVSHFLRLSFAYEDAIEQYERLCRNRDKSAPTVKREIDEHDGE